MLDAYGGVAAKHRFIVEAQKHGEKIRMQTKERLDKENVRWDFNHIEGDPVTAIIRESSLRDLAILGRPQGNSDKNRPTAFFGELLSHVRTPILFQPYDLIGINLAHPAIICWNGSIEAANALRSSLPLIKIASEVHIVSIDEDKPTELREMRLANISLIMVWIRTCNYCHRGILILRIFSYLRHKICRPVLWSPGLSGGAEPMNICSAVLPEICF